MDDDKMTDEALSTLKLLRTSAPSAEARKLALNAAMVAFDAAQPKAAQPKRSWINRWMLGAGLGVPGLAALSALHIPAVCPQSGIGHLVARAAMRTSDHNRCEVG